MRRRSLQQVFGPAKVPRLFELNSKKKAQAENWLVKRDTEGTSSKGELYFRAKEALSNSFSAVKCSSVEHGGFQGTTRAAGESLQERGRLSLGDRGTWPSIQIWSNLIFKKIKKVNPKTQNGKTCSDFLKLEFEFHFLIIFIDGASSMIKAIV